MKRKQWVFVLVGVLIITLLSVGFYVNYQLDHLVASLNKPGLIFVETDQSDTPAPNQQDSSPGSSGNSSSADTEYLNKATPSPGSDIASDVQLKVNRPIEKKDMLRAGLIILRRLDADEISYLYTVGSKDSYTREELVQVRQILLGKLSSHEIKTLRELGAKYGKSLRILDPNYKI